ncbi:COP9 signalosome complex subunit 4 [Endocarpon pusillum Z07020]|uniref:COP9 signalosome complex subunit 4 n=1 Tax=Endocarpon pusillum (strain Z07020 / HMAS-L-300199) TaxID=1263415 RepID=U1GER2_ENDPU|nr:COP9 signalosome complex subunit 4 [Endocarpon pusillum Z07020]ERF70211.1 COP9 signalosome complex subunit 4 [Endocarpon pusillum Z07020]
MASAGTTAGLESLSNASQDAKPKLYNNLLDQITTSKTSTDQLTADLVALSDSILSGSLSIVATRPLLTNFIQSLSKLSPDTVVTVGSHVLSAFQSQSTTFEEQEGLLREALCTAYEAQEDYTSAAKALQGIHLDTSQRQITDEAKVQMWIKIVRLYLEDDDTVSAEQALNKIKNLPSSNQTLASNSDLKLHYQLSQARILDARRKFLDASAEYLNVSLSTDVAEDDRLQALSAAIKTAILAPAGPQRSKTLGKLYKDERASETEEYGILEKMFLDRLLSAEEVDTFAASLLPHQLAQTADGSTVLAKAVIEHNLLAASRLYENISTMALGKILGLEDGREDTAAEKAEDYAARMMEQGRLKGKIDQIDGVISFEIQDGVQAGSSERELRMWDYGVQGLVEDVERCAAGISEAFPELTAERMVH